jgi:hypothetical protein
MFIIFSHWFSCHVIYTNEQDKLVKYETNKEDDSRQLNMQCQDNNFGKSGFKAKPSNSGTHCKGIKSLARLYIPY